MLVSVVPSLVMIFNRFCSFPFHSSKINVVNQLLYVNGPSCITKIMMSCMSLESERKPEYQRKLPQSQVGRANSETDSSLGQNQTQISGIVRWKFHSFLYNQIQISDEFAFAK